MRPSRRDLQVEVVRRFQHDGREPERGYRKLLVDWLNSSPDQRAIGRITELLHSLQIVARGFSRASEELLQAKCSGNPERISQLSCDVVNALNEACALMSEYTFRSSVCPHRNSAKWMIGWPCLYRPDYDSPSLTIPFCRNLSQKEIFELLRSGAKQKQQAPKEGDAVEALLFILADGLVGTIRRCEWKKCSKWYVGARRDARLRFCNRKCEEAYRDSSNPRKEKRRIYAQKRRTDERNENEQFLNEIRANPTPFRRNKIGTPLGKARRDQPGRK